jgi:hypothetical protein
MAHDVFISYSHHDKVAADAACAKLEEHQVRCWVAPRDVVPGAEWAKSIAHAINSSRVMVLVFSSKANDSDQIHREVQIAVNKSVIIVPLRIEDVLPTDALEYYMSGVHWLDALTRPLETHLGILVDVVKAMLERMPLRDAQGQVAPVHQPAVPPVKSMASVPQQPEEDRTSTDHSRAPAPASAEAKPTLDAGGGIDWRNEDLAHLLKAANAGNAKAQAETASRYL